MALGRGGGGTRKGLEGDRPATRPRSGRLATVIVDPQAEADATSHRTPAGALLDALERETRESLDSPQMLTGRLEGRFLQTLVWLAGARSVLEIGTYSGYSALSMASGLLPGGRIVTCELDPERAAF